ncbi:CRTAC1 family protein [Candidatus Uhrbacteria bacterium]|nr:MAG: CRTAC1 family protein [Candidatus Uhrbacteria bacterium]
MKNQFSVKTVLVLCLLVSLSLDVARTDAQTLPLLINTQQVFFQDIAAGDGAGIAYRRQEARGEALSKSIRSRTISLEELFNAPTLTGLAGVAVADFNNDGAEDLYVTNGRGRANSLYLNRLPVTGSVEFFEVATAAGAALTEQESSGVAVADIDNDGWRDLLVLGDRDANRLLRNRGSHAGAWLGFEDWTYRAGSQIAGGRDADGEPSAHTSASFGDFNADGLIDVAIARAFDHHSFGLPIFHAFHDAVQPNLLYLNMGNGVFSDMSTESGMTALRGFSDRNGPLQSGQTFAWENLLGDEFTSVLADEPATITWGIASVDIDLDGDIDIVLWDDQGGLPAADQNGADQGLIHILENRGVVEGVPQFTDITAEAGTAAYGAWMGGCFADFDSNGRLDIFGTNFGAYTASGFGPEMAGKAGNRDSRVFFGQADGTFADPGVGSLIRSAFGWGASCVDIDHDGYTDIVYRGGLDLLSFVDLSNPNNFYLRNVDGTGSFEIETLAFAGSANRMRNVYGLASGDLDNNGFVDVIAAASIVVPSPPYPVAPFPIEPAGAVLDVFARQFLRMVPINPYVQDPHDLRLAPVYPEDPGLLEGTLSVEMNSGNDNHWLKVKVRGANGKGSAHGRRGKVNRDGIGAIVLCTPEGGKTAMYPVMGGASFLSQDSTVILCGLGSATRGTVEVLWPGNVKNRHFNVEAGSTRTMVEIPYSYDDPTLSQSEYEAAVGDYLQALVDDGEIGSAEKDVLEQDAVRAFVESRGGLL